MSNYPDGMIDHEERINFEYAFGVRCTECDYEDFDQFGETSYDVSDRCPECGFPLSEMTTFEIEKRISEIIEEHDE